MVVTGASALMLAISFRQGDGLPLPQNGATGEGVPPLTEGLDGNVFDLGIQTSLAGQWVGLASWYGAKFEGRRTASGEVFLSRHLTLASRVIPLGSTVEITNLGNGKRVTARVNDRGPYIKGRGFDVSRGVARRLGFQKAGLAKVKVRILRSDKGQRPKNLSLPLPNQT